MLGSCFLFFQPQESLFPRVEDTEDVNARDKEWRTPVSLACQRGHLEACMVPW